MHRLLALSTLLLAASAAAQPAPPPLPADDMPSGAVLWVEPVALGTSLAVRDASDKNIYLPLGLSVPRGERSAWTFELGLAQYQSGCGDFLPHCHANGRMARALVGVSFSSAGQQRGLFVQPRLGLTVMRQEETVDDVSPGNPVSPAGTMFATDLGLDVGYQWRLKHLYLATMLGVSAGPAFNATADTGFFLDAFYNSPERSTRALVAVNLNLLRVGWGF